MYRVLFAEDELLVRMGLQNAVDWKKYDMELVAQADNGKDAYQLFLRLHPEVVITDIRMEGDGRLRTDPEDPGNRPEVRDHGDLLSG